MAMFNKKRENEYLISKFENEKDGNEVLCWPLSLDFLQNI